MKTLVFYSLNEVHDRFDSTKKLIYQAVLLLCAAGVTRDFISLKPRKQNQRKKKTRQNSRVKNRD